MHLVGVPPERGDVVAGGNEHGEEVVRVVDDAEEHLELVNGEVVEVEVVLLGVCSVACGFEEMLEKGFFFFFFLDDNGKELVFLFVVEEIVEDVLCNCRAGVFLPSVVPDGIFVIFLNAHLDVVLKEFEDIADLRRAAFVFKHDVSVIPGRGLPEKAAEWEYLVSFKRKSAPGIGCAF